MTWPPDDVAAGDQALAAKINEIIDGLATRELFIPVHHGSIATENEEGQFANWMMDAAAEKVYFSFKVPHDFSAILVCKVVGIAANAGGNTFGWTATADFAADTESATTHEDSATANGIALGAGIIQKVDISAALTGLLADDLVGIEFLMDAITGGNFKVLGLEFKYS